MPAAGRSLRRLPPLSGLEAFVAVARTGSVKAAAAALALSMPALSRRVQGLERHVGVPLFERTGGGMRLTRAGDQLHAALGPALDALHTAVESVGERASLRLRLNVLPLFAQQRLFPRLPELRRQHPDLHIDIDTGGLGEARLGDGIDAAIVIARNVDPTLHAVRLDQDRIYPIASPDLRDQGGIRTPADLARHTVLIHREMPETFQEWAAVIGQPELQPSSIDLFDSGALMLEAAAQGVGVAFMHGHHLDDAHDPRLVRLFDYEIDSPYSYWFLCRPAALRRPAVRLFHDWIAKAQL